MLRNITVAAILLSFLTGCSTAIRTGTTDDVQPETSSSETIPVTEGTKKQPKIGIILGPGGLKSFAHIGVLRELENARIPISYIAGTEWGSLVAGIYSIKGKSNDAEWKLFKLPKNILPKREFIGRRTEPTSMTDMSAFLDSIFERQEIQQGAIPFMCPARSMTKYSNLIFQKNSYADAIELCLPFPPFFKPHENWVASPFSIKALADSLRRVGAEYIVVVNVTPGIQRLNDDASAAEVILWNQIMNEMNDSKNHVDYVIDVNIQDKSILDFEARREFILIGQQYGKIAAQRLARILGF